MARTAPFPNAASIPGMCPGVAVMGRGGAAGGEAGQGGGAGNAAAGQSGQAGGDDASGNSRDACGGVGDGGGCPNDHGSSRSGVVTRGDPVDVVTGRVTTDPAVDLELPGPLSLVLARSYSSAARARDVGLGFGMTHTLAWEIFEMGPRVLLHTHDGLAIDLDAPDPGAGSLGPHGWILHRDGPGFALDLLDERRLFLHEPAPAPRGRRFRLSRIEDRHHNRISIIYRDGLLSEIVDSVGRVVRVHATREGRWSALSLEDAPDPGQRTTLARYTYDDAGRLVAADDADGARTTFAYDDRNLLVAHARPSGLTFHYRHDHALRCIETWGEHPDGRDPGLSDDVPALLTDRETRARGVLHVKLHFDGEGYTEASDSVTHHSYFGNAHGKLDKAVSAGAVFTRQYDDLGFLVAFTDACGATTTWDRDARGRELRVTDALGNTTLITRDSDGHIREIVDPAGATTVVDRRPDALVFRDPLGATFEIQHDRRGLLERTVAPSGDVTRYRHDHDANLVEITDARGGVSRATHDAWGRCTSIVDAAGATTRYRYSPGGKLLEVISPDGTATRYDHDPAGRLASIRDPRGEVRLAHGGLDRLCEVIAPNGERTSLRYDREGRLAAVTRARGEVHRYVRRADGVVVEEHTFDGRVERAAHDRMGRPTRLVNGANERVEIERDLLGRMIRRTTSDGLEERFERDARGDVVRAVSGEVSVSFERNDLGWIVREIQAVEGDPITVEIAYDLMGRVARRSTSLGHTALWTRHETGATVVLDGERIETTHDPLGREIARDLPRGGRIESAYSPDGRLVFRRALDTTRAPPVGPGEPDWVGPWPPVVTVEQRYAHAAGLLLEKWDHEAGLTRFEHDALGRLTAVLPEHAPPEHFHYGPGGDLHETPESTRAYGPGGRLLRRGDVTYTWDRAGRVEMACKADGSFTRYRWTALGHLRAVERSDGTRIDYKYDAFHRRVLARVSHSRDGAWRAIRTTRFVWDGTTLVHTITTTSGPRGPVIDERTYCFEERRTAPWAHRDARTVNGARTETGWHHYLNDDTGAPERLVDARGRVTCALRWTAWGHAEAAKGSTTTTPIRFRGQYADAETGLSYNLHRYYDPTTGRYLTPDPLGLLGGLDPYAYAGNSPTSAIDAEGLMYTVIKRGKEIIADGENEGVGGGVKDWDEALAGRAKAMEYRSGCSESAALNDLAKQIRRERPGFTDEHVRAEMRRRFTEEGYTIETYEGNRKEYAKSFERNRVLVNPCDKCGAMLKDLGVAGSVLAANKPNGPKRGPERWDQKSLYRPGKHGQDKRKKR